MMRLGMMIAKLHTVTTPKQIGLNDELFSLEFYKETLYNSNSIFGGLVNKNKITIEKTLMHLKYLFDSSITNSDFKKVLTHGDMHSGNILFTKDSLFLIDFENLQLGHREKDFIFILDYPYRD